ncbi:unnamed protein product [Umbelopsis ramanniana]
MDMRSYVLLVALDNIIESCQIPFTTHSKVVEPTSLNDKDMTLPKHPTSPEPVWLFEDLNKEGSWIPFDLKTQEILEHAYQNYGELFNTIKKRALSDHDDNVLQRHNVQYELVHEHIKVIVQDSHFDEPVSLFPISFLACLQDADLLLDRRGTGQPDDYISTFSPF